MWAFPCSFNVDNDDKNYNDDNYNDDSDNDYDDGLREGFK